MEDRASAILKWMNNSFQVLSKDKLSSIVQLNDPVLPSDEPSFSGLSFLPEDTEISRNFNMSLISRSLANFYQDNIKKPFDETFFNPKDSKTESNFIRLGELIAGIAAHCDRTGYYIEMMQNLSEHGSSEMYNILLERIYPCNEESQKTDDSNPKQDTQEDENEAEDTRNENAMLIFRVENLEKENIKLSDENKNLNNKISELTKMNYFYELSTKEAEAKYQELVTSIEKKEIERFNDKAIEETVNMSIQLSELKGKLEAKEKNLVKIREDKEKIVEEYKIKLMTLQKENGILKEQSVKYEVLKEKMQKFSMEEMTTLKNKLMQSEKLIKDQEDKIKKLKNYDVDKSILLKRIEDLTVEMSLEKEKSFELSKEGEHYRHMIIQNENELKALKSEIEHTRNSNSDKRDSSLGSIKMQQAFSLTQIEEAENTKAYVLELETKIKLAVNDKEMLVKEKAVLEEKLAKQSAVITENTQTIEKYASKIEKYSKFKQENQTFLTKISDLMDRLQDCKTENENLKISHSKEKAEIEANNSIFISQLNKRHNEDSFKIKEYENENAYLKKELKKSEELTESNKMYIDELQRKLNYPNSDSKLFFEIESKLKELTETENIDLKKKCSEKDDLIAKLNEKIKHYDAEVKEMNQKIEKLRKISSEIPSEIAKRDEVIEYYKSQLESKEKLFIEEERLVASLFHNLAYQYNVSQAKISNSEEH